MHTASGADRADTVVARLAASPALRQRRFDLLPLHGPGAPTSRPQGRRPGPATSQTGLADLISSIATHGLLAPVLAEEIPAAGAPNRLIVAGERRVMSIRRGAAAAPQNPHFAQIPAIVCPGPLTEEERRSWQLIENLAREDLQPGELGAALVFERCAVLAAELENAGAQLPPTVLAEPDPVERYQQLQQLRQQHPTVGASWQVVLRRLGLQLSARKARAVAAALTGLPRHLSEELDQHKVALYTRLELLKVGAGRPDAAAELWEAVKRRGRPDLLAATVRVSQAGITDSGTAVDVAEGERDAANEARRAALTATPPPTAAPAPAALPYEPPGPTGAVLPATSAGDTDADEDSAPDENLEPVAPRASAATGDVVQALLAALRDTVRYLVDGGELHRFDAGSVRLLTTQLLHHLEATADPKPRAAA